MQLVEISRFIIMLSTYFIMGNSIILSLFSFSSWHQLVLDIIFLTAVLDRNIISYNKIEKSYNKTVLHKKKKATTKEKRWFKT